MKKYEHKKIEKRWQKFWEAKKFYRARDFDKKKKFYTLVEFPYPSGDGLHVGHVRSYAALDAVARWRRMTGHNVLYPIGFDAFGLPTENFAIKNKIHPRIATDRNIKTFTRQLKVLGISFDWPRAVDTTDPKYYKWTQWIFLQLYKAGLAYRDKIPINWCPKCKTGLANEEVINGKHERCGTLVTKKLLKQWVIKITKYADRLIKDLDLVDYPDRVKTQQINWIGRSEGAEIDFSIVIPASEPESNTGSRAESKTTEKIKVFTTRPDTIFGATYLVVAPEHPLIQNFQFSIFNFQEVKKYVDQAQKRSELDRTAEGKEKTGVELKGIFVTHPLTNEKLPVWVADYVLTGYGTGAIMAVPAHDERDFAFAKKYGLPVKQVVAPHVIDYDHLPRPGKKDTNRVAVHAIVKHPTENKILSLKWKIQPWRTLVTGGVEAGEDVIEAAKREVYEETGYKNLRFVGKLPYVIRSDFYAAHKDVNRFNLSHFVSFKLENLERDEPAEEEQKRHEAQWIDEKDIGKLSPLSEMDHLLDWLKRGEHAYTGDGLSINSDFINGLETAEAKRRIIDRLEKGGVGRGSVSYKLRDWIFSRQHYWGEPIPLVFCPECKKQAEISKSLSFAKASESGQVPISKLEKKYSIGELENPGWIAVPEKDLPVKLPNVKSYEPTDTGESPLAAIKSFVNTKCPVCGGPAKRETDTMPNWAGSNWYFIRYTDPKNNKAFADRKKIDYWLGTQGLDAALSVRSPKGVGGVDLYNGGMEHTTLHLLYSRFIYKFLFDQGFVGSPEPYAKRTSHGIILAEDGRKMSKSFGNVVNPDVIVAEHGADTLRMYEMFIAPFDQMVPWDARGVLGVRRFLDRVWKYYSSNLKAQSSKPQSTTQNEKEFRIIHKFIKKVTSDLAGMKFNTIVAAFMETFNALESISEVSKKTLETYLVLLAPFAPHFAEELWAELGNKKSVHLQSWPGWDERYLADDTVKIPISVNGKTRDIIEVPKDAPEEKVGELAKNSAKIRVYLKDKTIIRTIYVPGRMINFVVK